LPSCIEQGLASSIAGGFTRSAERIPVVDKGEIEANFEDVLASSVQHFFIETDTSDPIVAEEATGLDRTITTSESIT
jgi:hypothetical protein